MNPKRNQCEQGQPILQIKLPPGSPGTKETEDRSKRGYWNSQNTYHERCPLELIFEYAESHDSRQLRSAREGHQIDQVGGWTDGQLWYGVSLLETRIHTYLTPTNISYYVTLPGRTAGDCADHSTLDFMLYYCPAASWRCCTESEPCLLLGCMYQNPHSVSRYLHPISLSPA